VSAPQPPARTSRTVAIVCGTFAGLIAAVVLVIAAPGVWEWWSSPILPAPASSPVTFGPLPASTAGPAPITPVELRDCPINGCGPR
jgi:hypothetical protein